MKCDIVLAGVGGQGILTIAKLLSMAAQARGWNVKQAEVHGMSQRGGAVYSHLRISDEAIFSDLIPLGQADLILAVEPLEALRYVSMLKKDGAIVSSADPMVNVEDYPELETVLEHITAFPNHVLFEMDKHARAAGNTLAANLIALGAASHYLPFDETELRDVTKAAFGSKGERVAEVNIRAFCFGSKLADCYQNATKAGIDPQTIRARFSKVSAEQLDLDEPLAISEACHAG